MCVCVDVYAGLWINCYYFNFKNNFTECAYLSVHVHMYMYMFCVCMYVHDYWALCAHVHVHV